VRRRHDIDNGPVTITLSRIFAEPLIRKAITDGVTVDFLVRQILSAEMTRWWVNDGPSAAELDGGAG
jgi:hypothetical protein